MKRLPTLCQFSKTIVPCSVTMFLIMSATMSLLAQNTSQIAKEHPGWVQVPGELIRPECVHQIPNGANVTVGQDGQPTGDVTLNGKFIAHYDACSEAPVITRHQGTTTAKGDNPSPINGWVEASQWDVSLSGSDNIDLMDGEWYVPNKPSSNGALIYLFNGIEPSSQNWILQPVLQYGASPAGGGNYWGIASWLVSSGGYAFHSPLVSVNPGNLLFGFTEITGTSGSSLNWEVEAYDTTTGGYSWITATTSGLHWTWAYAGVLEVYGVSSCSQLPSSGYALFEYNSVYHGYPAYNYISPQGWYGAIYGTGGLSCGFGVYAGNTSVLYY